MLLPVLPIRTSKSYTRKEDVNEIDDQMTDANFITLGKECGVE